MWHLDQRRVPKIIRGLLCFSFFLTKPPAWLPSFLSFLLTTYVLLPPAVRTESNYFLLESFFFWFPIHFLFWNHHTRIIKSDSIECQTLYRFFSRFPRRREPLLHYGTKRREVKKKKPFRNKKKEWVLFTLSKIFSPPRKKKKKENFES